MANETFKKNLIELQEGIEKSSKMIQSLQKSLEQTTMEIEQIGQVLPDFRSCTDRSTPPKNAKYANKTARVSSCNDCGDIVIPPDSLDTSGCFNAGFGDCLRCFQCGVECSANVEIERQMHTDAVKSVLEMGYSQDVIRNALRAIRNIDDGRALNATILMEKIFELEDEASALVQGTPENQIGKNYFSSATSKSASIESVVVSELPPATNSYSGPTELFKTQTRTDRSTPPKYPKYASKTARVSSYNDCGDSVIQPDSLATSGFFYAGFGDCVRCFQCGVGLRHWSEEDDPWIEHSRWSKDCLFVKQVRGQEFVNIVQMAVQYSQNTNGNSQASVTNQAASTTECSASVEIERQMHTDAVQSVLEMGYSRGVIRNALRAIRNRDDGRTLSTRILIEKILDLEDEQSALVQGTPDNQISINHSGSASSKSDCIESVGMCDMAPAKKSDSGLTKSFRTETPSLDISCDGIDETWELNNENQRLRNILFCRHCKNKVREVVFLSCPCPHLLFCNVCYLFYDICPVCNTPVKALMNVRW